MTNNGVNSLENAVYIKDLDIVFAYYEEWCKILACSETFNWSSKPLNQESKGINREFKPEH